MGHAIAELGAVAVHLQRARPRRCASCRALSVPLRPGGAGGRKAAIRRPAAGHALGRERPGRAQALGLGRAPPAASWAITARRSSTGCPTHTDETLRPWLQPVPPGQRQEGRGRHPQFGLPQRLWRTPGRSRPASAPTPRWSEVPAKAQNRLLELLLRTLLAVQRQNHPQGGVRDLRRHSARAKLNLKTMQSRRVPGLYFAGEVLDIDGITGGFNFQAAWTTGFLAGRAMAAGGLPPLAGNRGSLISGSSH
ncbi:MAG: NAD(P)/FAD-dependent oxidoreductase [Hymenobacter sp.]